MAFTAKDVQALREQTGVGMMDCKKALQAADGDMEKAIEVLRKHGMAKAEKKSGRATNQGKIAAAVRGNAAAMVEVLCETDFAADTDKFKELVNAVLEAALKAEGEGCVTEQVAEACKALLTEKIATIGENMQIRRAVKWNCSAKAESYIHGGGRVGVLVEVANEDDAAFIHSVCLHVAAFNPAYICSADVPAEKLASEREIAAAQVEGKPAPMIEKIVNGKINKWYTEVCLVNQPWITDDKTCIAKLKPNAKIVRFARWEVGEEL